MKAEIEEEMDKRLNAGRTNKLCIWCQLRLQDSGEKHDPDTCRVNLKAVIGEVRANVEELRIAMEAERRHYEWLLRQVEKLDELYPDSVGEEATE